MLSGISGWELEAAYWQPDKSALQLENPWEFHKKNLIRYLSIPASLECNISALAHPSEFDFTIHPLTESSYAP